LPGSQKTFQQAQKRVQWVCLVLHQKEATVTTAETIVEKVKELVTSKMDLPTNFPYNKSLSFPFHPPTFGKKTP